MTLKGKITAALAPVPLAFLCAVCPALALADEDTAGAYTVTIPAEVQISSVGTSGTATITGQVSAHHIVSVTASSSGELRCADGADSLTYELSGTSFEVRAEASDEPIEQQITATLKGGAPRYAGSYTDTVSFDIRCQDTYALTFDVQGGALPDSEETSRELKPGEAYGELPVPTREDYVFVGWYTAGEGGEQVSADTQMGSAHTTLYAHWQENKNLLTINYHSGGAQKWHSYQDGKYHTIQGDDEVVEVEKVHYNETYEHAIWGLLDVGRLTRDGYTTGNAWQVKVNGTYIKDASDQTELPKGKNVAAHVGVMDLIAQSDVTIDLYPVFKPAASSATQAEEDGDVTAQKDADAEDAPSQVASAADAGDKLPVSQEPAASDAQDSSTSGATGADASADTDTSADPSQTDSGSPDDEHGSDADEAGGDASGSLAFDSSFDAPSDSPSDGGTSSDAYAVEAVESCVRETAAAAEAEE